MMNLLSSDGSVEIKCINSNFQFSNENVAFLLVVKINDYTKSTTMNYSNYRMSAEML